MGLDIFMFRDEATANLIRESQRRRYADPESVDKVIEADAGWRKIQFLSECTKKFVNDCSRAVAAKKKAKEADGEDIPVPEEVIATATEGKIDSETLQTLNVNQLKSLSKWCNERVAALAKQASDAENTRDSLLNSIGNIVHESVPVEKDEDVGNTTVRTFGDIARRMPLNHVDIMEKLGLMDTGKAVTSMAGGRSYVLKGGLVQLQVALISYGISFLVSRGYTPFYPPFFMNKETMACVAQLSQFDEELYKVTGEGEDKYLIATSEMPIAAYHRNKTFPTLKEPIKYAGMSACFRKEAGAHGRDTTGIFRVHQFDKIEQFVVCNPRDEESWKILEDMILTSEEFCKSLGLPYRVINICSGALNNAAAKKYDLEAWFPGSGAFRELVSCSNCTDYQARGVSCRFGADKGANKEFVHMLNGTLCAVTRTMCCIAENYQTEEGVIIPEVLRPFMLGRDILKYDTTPASAESA
ncbi:seryl-tRNA synthetase, putative [Bodo saltans]|uniref:serine--tRNA ligase n=1 Tax=Bodo saltans TaxID=75058 RepID=A0A0S4JVV1_BODSA|nr:seryl-tRNA synthetase, putative [Bodo saltans]|eukprot:CUG94179.1 seryl-tRNA synthetase, putative [Bodo saltans]